MPERLDPVAGMFGATCYIRSEADSVNLAGRRMRANRGLRWALWHNRLHEDVGKGKRGYGVHAYGMNVLIV